MKPIIFSTPMVQAILEGRKTQTRRVIKPQPALEIYLGVCVDSPNETDIGKRGFWNLDLEKASTTAKYQPGDLLWVRETWSFSRKPFKSGTHKYYYKADGAPKDYIVKFRWRPSIHMPLEAARLFLRVTNVRVERIQDISVEDCFAEGIPDEWTEACPRPSYVGIAYTERKIVPAFRDAYRELWDGFSAKNSYGWASNPWVWVYEFEQTEKGSNNNECGNQM